MNATSHDNKTNLMIAETYYQHMLQKNFDDMANCLHPDVHFLGPLAEMKGRTDVVEAAKKLSTTLEDIKIKSKFSAGDEIMLAYDFKFSSPASKLRAAVLMGFKDKLISKIELYFDGRPFEERKPSSIESKR